MLYDRWREVARELSDELALTDFASGRRWTFAQLDAAAQPPPVVPHVAFPQGIGAQFVIEVLRGWRHERIICPIEAGQSAPRFPLPPARVAHLKVTSATTGAPKLVAFTAEQMAADASNIVATMGLRREWPNLGFISLAHSYGFSNLVTPLLLHGIPLIVGGQPLPESVRKACEAAGQATLAGVPALWRVWHEAEAITKNVRLAISAGAPLPLALEHEVFQRSGLKIHNFYGASECGGIAFDSSNEPRADAACVGAPMANVALAVNPEGCLEVRGAAVGETYWPDLAEGLQAGVYRSSDVAELRDGQVWLRGRATDVINVAGRKIAPETVERRLAMHPDVCECLVFGVPVPEARGDTMVACVVARRQVTAEALRSFLLTHGAAWEAPREIWFVESLEANQRGKLSRAEWRRRFEQRR